MNRFLALPLLILVYLLISYQIGFAQQLNGVYAGVELRLSVMMGGGMDRNDNVIYFRPDGTLTHQLGKPGWKTDVTGRYQVSGKKVSILYNNGSKDNMTLTAAGDLDAGSYTLFRLNIASTVPPGFYKLTYAGGVGGGVSGMTYVGSSGQTGLTFDGKGNFSRNQSSATVIAGDNIGGGSSRKTNSGGTYTMKDGVLTLAFTDGTSKTQSFFWRSHKDYVMAALDGRLYFTEDPKEESRKAASRPVKATPSEQAAPVSATIDGLSLLKKANLAHGGKALDALKTVKVSAVTSGIRVTTFVDISVKKIRVELRMSNKLVGVEQLEGNTGWQWRNGQKTALQPGRIKEMLGVFTTGVLGLRSANLATLPSPKVTPTDKGMTTLTYQLDGTTFVIILDADNRLVGEGNTLTQQLTSVAYSDLKSVSGIMLPFTENQTTGTQKLAIRYEAYQINPDLSADTWADPN